MTIQELVQELRNRIQYYEQLSDRGDKKASKYAEQKQQLQYSLDNLLSQNKAGNVKQSDINLAYEALRRAKQNELKKAFTVDKLKMYGIVGGFLLVLGVSIFYIRKKKSKK